MSKAATLMAVVATLGLAPYASADSPPNLATPDSHSVPAKGKITLYRVQAQNLGLGTGENKTDAELMVQLDTDPKMVYTLQLDANAPPVNKVLADTLRDAYMAGTPVTVYRQITTGDKTISQIHMVQMEK